MTVRYERERGYYVTAIEAGEEFDLVLADPGGDEDRVVTTVRGSSERLPALLFVSEPVAFRAARRFVDTGRRSRRCQWRDIFLTGI